ncbi:MAG: tyrosine-type recombinase/integrase [Phormidesmis sp.]
MADLAKPGSFEAFLDTSSAERDLIAELLADKRSPATRRAYLGDLKDFFLTVTRAEASPRLVREFLQLDRATAIAAVTKYKALLITAGKSEATVNRRLAAVKSLVRYAQNCGQCEWSLESVRGERVQGYRDTTGISIAAYAKVIAQPKRRSLKGKRDYAILRLLWDNALRRAEVSSCDVQNFDPDRKQLAILGKGKGTQLVNVSISDKTISALSVWLQARDRKQPFKATDPLFISLASNSWGHRLTGSAIYNLVRAYAKAAGLVKIFSPHRVRHSATTAALGATGGDVLTVQMLTRHAKIETLMLYNDNRENRQGDVSEQLADLA